MLARLLCLFLLGGGAYAGTLVGDWPIGKTEKLTYEITILVPQESKNYINLEVTKTAGPAFTVVQNLSVPTQSVEIKSVEKYTGVDLKFVSAVNSFALPASMKQQAGVDSIIITAKAANDSLDITTNVPAMPPQKIAMPANLTTSAGTLFTTRNLDLKVGATHKTNLINFLNFNGQPYTTAAQVDSVIGEETVTVPAGTFKCFKVKNTIDQMVGYTYISAVKNHLPVMLERIDPATGKQMAKVELQKTE